jgi:hypothetical protein
MKSRTFTCITAITLFAALAIAVRPRPAAQEWPAVQRTGAQRLWSAGALRFAQGQACSRFLPLSRTSVRGHEGMAIWPEV